MSPATTSSPTDPPPAAPEWAPRVPPPKIARLYEDDARGLHDADLLADVGFALHERCRSMLQVEAARQGRATCPLCAALIEHDGKPDSQLPCACGWRGTWAAYRATFRGAHLIAPGLRPFCEEFVETYPMARTPAERMLRIDWLLHRVHWEGTALPGQRAAVCLIEGRSSQVNDFLEALTQGRHRQALADDRGYWTEEERQQIATWRRRAEARGTVAKDGA